MNALRSEQSRHLLQREPGSAILSALNQLLENDSYLLQVDANERSITHRLAMYLQCELRDWHVDCEYNRNGEVSKCLMDEPADSTDGSLVYPDIIVHRRGQYLQSPCNYLVVEAKKDTSARSASDDIDKLSRFQRDPRYRYQYALFIEFSTTPPGVLRLEWIDAAIDH